jgi:tRNA pseudouridine13 synthase
MRIKQKPEDFSVKESFRFDEVDSGRYRVYLMDKQKLSTFDAVLRLQQRFGLRPGSISYCGLKDKQGRTEQLIAVDGFDVDVQEPDLRLKYMGRTDRPLSAENTTSNRFSVTVRAVKDRELSPLNVAAAEVNRLGVVNYFDSQRFGSLKHGQGFVAKDLMRGDFETALKNHLARPSPLDKTDDAKVKQFWLDHWGDWTQKCPYAANARYARILKALRDEPRDFRRAFLEIDRDQRAMFIFAYQSYLWNEGVRRLLQLMFPREHLFPIPYQAGTLLFHKDAAPALLNKLRTLTFPLLAPNTTFLDPQIEEAAIWALGKDKLTLDKLTVPGAEKLLFFKHEERPVLVYPHKLVLGRTQRDELNKPFLKLNIAFTLPPGSYATLVVKRLFHFGFAKGEAEAFGLNDPRSPPAHRGSNGERYEKEARAERPERSARTEHAARPERSERRPERTERRPERPLGQRPEKKSSVAESPSLRSNAPLAPSQPQGFRARQKAKKANKLAERSRNQLKSKNS